MNTKLFGFIVLAILIAQPLVITTSIALDGVLIKLGENEAVIKSQDFGTRLLPEEHTNHVPIVINGTDDFVLQSWPGDGSAGNPFVISGLNITYNHPDVLIKITNTDSYFTIQDCYLKQLSSESGILLENVTHGTIQYVTLISDGGGIFTVNADGSTINRLHVESLNEYSFYANYSPNLDLSYSLFNSTSSGAVYVNSSDSSSLRDSIFDSSYPYTDLTIRYSDNLDLLDAEFHVSSIELYVGNCDNFYADGLLAPEGDQGIWLINCNNSVIRNADITSNYNALYMSGCLNISIINSVFSNTMGSQCLYLISSSEILFDNILVNDTNNQAFSATLSHDVTISNSVFSNIPGECIWFTSSNDTDILSNSFESISDTVIAVTSGSHRANVSYNIVSGITGDGFYSSNSDNGTLSHNNISGGTLGIYLQSSSGWEIHDNVIENADTGISIEGGAHADIWDNDISMCANYGFYALSHGTIELWENTISDSTTGMYLENCDYQYIRDNVVTRGVRGMNLQITVNSTFNDNIFSDFEDSGIILENVVTSAFDGNNISGCGIAGFNLYSGDYNSFKDNNLIDCGFLLLIEPISMQLYNHSFSGNTVNGKPLYYAINQTGFAVNGNLYGQIIITNCTDITVTGGEFVKATCGVQIMFSTEISVSGITYADQFLAAFALVTDNVTFADSTIVGDNNHGGIFIWEAGRPMVDNCTFDGIGGSWFGFPSAVFVAGFFNMSITDSWFTDIDGSAIALFPGVSPSAFGYVKDCTIVNATSGITAMDVGYLEVKDNSFLWGTYGIEAQSGCDFWTVEWNEMQDNHYGIYRSSSDNWFFANNTIRWNVVGVELIGSVGTTSADNIIALNFDFNGVDNIGNFWDDGVDTGNYWDDYSGSGVYNIGGTGGAQDRYPMQYIVYDPIINTPEDFAYSEGSEGNEIIWLPFDNFLRDWTVTIDGEPWASGIWNFSNVTVNIDGLAYGAHTVFVTVWDVDNNFVNDTVIVTVYDVTPPEIVGPPDIVMFVDDDLSIEWEVTDLNPTDYNVTVDGVEFETGTWTSGALSIDFTGIDTGEHNITMTIYDVDGNSASNLVVVLIIDDDTDPTIDHPDDVLYIEGTTGNVIVWSPGDEYAESYSVSSNGSLVESGDWAGSRVSVDVDGLDVGWFEYTITVYDRSGNSATDTVNVTVILLIQELPVPMVDWVLLIIIGAVVGGVIVVVAIIYYLKKKKTGEY